MRIQINAANLIDFPYRPGYSTHFHFDKNQLQSLTSEILYGTPTCYLVSGYRGAGKTSFIKKVQELCETENALLKADKDLIFVHSNFSRFENRTNFLRKIIRDLHKTITVLKNNEHNEAIRDLYKLTFADIKTEITDTTEQERETEISFDLGGFIKTSWPIVSALLISIFSAFSTFGWIEGVSKFITGIGWLSAAMLSLIGLFKISQNYKFRKASVAKKSEISMMDDDIINYYLENLINTFNDKGHRLVFVLDELDKIDEEELDKLLKEMKPWLVGGRADFILVAGQKLTMKYYQHRKQDDALLTSLFSKIIHINLHSEHSLDAFFLNFLYKGVSSGPDTNFDKADPLALSAKEKDLLLQLIDKYIFRSKCLPRNFINLIRQDLKWNKNICYLETFDGEPDVEAKKQRLLTEFFEKIELNASISATARDYLIMSLYRLIDEMECQVETAVALPVFKCEYEEMQKWHDQFAKQIYESAADKRLIRLKPDSNQANTESSVPDNEPGPELRKFHREYNDFINILGQLVHELANQQAPSTEELKLDTLLKIFSESQLINVKPTGHPFFNQSPQFFNNNSNHKDTLSKLQSALENAGVNMPQILETLLKKFVVSKLDKLLPPELTRKPSLDFESNLADWNYLSGEFYGNPDILFRYLYINGDVHVTSDQAEKLISHLSFYNRYTKKGNYLVQIIFAQPVTSHLSHEEVAAEILVNDSRPDLNGKIKYIILPASWIGNLESKIKSIKANAEPYSILPSLVREFSDDALLKQQTSPTVTISGNSIDPQDIQKGKWGGKSENRTRRLSAEVYGATTPQKKQLKLTVQATEPSYPLAGTVTFYLHQSFIPNIYTATVNDNGIAELTIDADKAFTVGATCDNSSVALELDLNDISGLPDSFYTRPNR